MLFPQLHFLISKCIEKSWNPDANYYYEDLRVKILAWMISYVLMPGQPGIKTFKISGKGEEEKGVAVIEIGQ